jgi:hypothetical protein
VALSSHIPDSTSWPKSPALGVGLPASPTLEDLGNPVWIDAYRRAGGLVRTLRGAEGAHRTHLTISPTTHQPSPSPPGALKIAQEATDAVDQGVGSDVARPQISLGGASPVGPATNPETSPPASLRPPIDLVFAGLRHRAAAWLDIFCPKVNRCLEAAHDAIIRGDEESLAHAALSLRRGLIALADHVEPPGDEKRRDHMGNERTVGREQFKNRLYIYLGTRLESAEHRSLTLTELELVEQRLSPFVRAMGKAVHADGEKDDLNQMYATTWSVVAQVVRCAEAPS